MHPCVSICECVLANIVLGAWQEPGRPADAETLSIQTTISLADELGLIPAEDYPEVISNLVQDIVGNNSGHLNTGIVGIKYLLPTLSRANRTDIALHIAQTDTQPVRCMC